eukprot:6210332-Pleurochrysis_carterae.AAC.1
MRAYSGPAAALMPRHGPSAARPLSGTAPQRHGPAARAGCTLPFPRNHHNHHRHARKVSAAPHRTQFAPWPRQDHHLEAVLLLCVTLSFHPPAQAHT